MMTSRQAVPPREHGDLAAAGRTTPGAAARLRAGAVGVLLFSVVVALQVSSGAYRNEFGGHPDEAAHYITGLMVRDFLLGGEWGDPMGFAEDYYLHYPKVGIGHWPPFFYVVQASWTALVPPSRASALLLMALLMSLLAWAVYRSVEEEFGAALAIAMALALCLAPVSRGQSGKVMTEPLVSLLAYRAALSLGSYVGRARWRDATLFGAWAALTIMTNGAGLALALVPPLTLLLARRGRLLLRPSFYWPALLVLALCGPWYVLTLEMARNGWAEQTPSLQYSIGAIRSLGDIPRGIGTILVGLAVLGVAARVLRPFLRGGAEGRCAALFALAVAVPAFHCIVPCSPEFQRYIMPSLAPICHLAAAGIGWLADRIPGPRDRNRSAFAFAALALVASEGQLSAVRDQTNRGFRRAAADLQALAPRDATLLVSSDDSGEGMLICELANRELRPGRVVLRASKVLGTSGWSGSDFTPCFRTVAEVMDYLIGVPVDIVIVDTSITPAAAAVRQHALLIEAIHTEPDRWEFLGAYPRTRGRITSPGAIRVYRLLHGRQGEPRRIRVDMRRMLGRAIDSRGPI